MILLPHAAVRRNTTRKEEGQTGRRWFARTTGTSGSDKSDESAVERNLAEASCGGGVGGRETHREGEDDITSPTVRSLT